MAFFGLGSGSLLGLFFVYLWSDRISAVLTKKHGGGKPEVLRTMTFFGQAHVLVPTCSVLLGPVSNAHWVTAVRLVCRNDLALVITCKPW
jgi:hypothetical protein